jgi:hypothetical protein
MENQKIDAQDHLQQHCRMLGHRIPFEYCRSMNSNLPCNKILDCWKNILPIDKFLRQNFTDDEMAIFLAPAKPKLAQIYEMMKKAEKSGDKSRK